MQASNTLYMKNLSSTSWLILVGGSGLEQCRDRTEIHTLGHVKDGSDYLSNIQQEVHTRIPLTYIERVPRYRSPEQMTLMEVWVRVDPNSCSTASHG